MNDDFLRQARADWRAQDSGAARLLHRLRRGRWTPHALLGLDVAGCVLLAVAGLWFAWIAARAAHHQILLAISAAVLLASAPMIAVAGVLARRGALHWEDKTPEDILRIGVARAEASLKVMRVGWWQIATLIAFVAGLWALEAIGFLNEFGFLVLYTPICIVWATLCALWFLWRQARLVRERAACLRLLAEFGGGDEPEA
jgi:hypothetical protein